MSIKYDFRDIKKIYYDGKPVDTILNEGIIVWTDPNIIDVLFDMCTDDQEYAEQREYLYKRPYGEFPEPEWSGYTFLGWYTGINGGEKITDDMICSIPTFHVLYAHWQINSYNLIFDSQGGSSVEARTLRYHEEIGDLPTPTKKSHKFLGWYWNLNGGSQVTKTDVFHDTYDRTIYAKWELIIINIAFDTCTDDYEDDRDAESREYVYEEKYGSFPTPEWSAHTFLGWYTTKTGGQRIYETDICTYIYGLYAHWQINSYSLIFDSQGGSSVSSRSIQYGAQIGTLPTPTKKSHEFLGWYWNLSGGSQVLATDLFYNSTDRTIYAKWRLIVVNVFFDMCTDNPEYVEQREYIYEEVYGSFPTPEWSAHTFLGWYTAQVGGAKITADMVCNSKNFIGLYAHWQINSYNLIFDSQGGSSVSSRSIQYGAQIGTLPTPTRSGYEFLGWYANLSGGSQVLATDRYYYPHDRTIYAKWKQSLVRQRTDTLYLCSSGEDYSADDVTWILTDYAGIDMKSNGGKITVTSTVRGKGTMSVDILWPKGANTPTYVMQNSGYYYPLNYNKFIYVYSMTATASMSVSYKFNSNSITEIRIYLSGNVQDNQGGSGDYIYDTQVVLQ